MHSSFILVVKANELFDDALSWIMYFILLTFFPIHGTYVCHAESDNFSSVVSSVAVCSIVCARYQV